MTVLEIRISQEQPTPSEMEPLSFFFFSCVVQVCWDAPWTVPKESGIFSAGSVSLSLTVRVLCRSAGMFLGQDSDCRVHAICPAFVDTPLVQGKPQIDEYIKAYQGRSVVISHVHSARDLRRCAVLVYFCMQ